jgi:DNA polymerase sigma
MRLKTHTMKTLINNASTGLMIGGAAVLLVCAFLQMSSEVAQGTILMLGAGLIKVITAKE